MTEAVVFTGGCQCGAVRFRYEGPGDDVSICHCRMCQKAFGNVYAPLVSTRKGTLTWTREEPARFQSSNLVKRGFCPKCGTPLTYEAPDGVSVALGAFDHPETLVPTFQYGLEGKLAYVDSFACLPGSHTEEDVTKPNQGFLSQIVSYQHPDHDTSVWPEDEPHPTGPQPDAA